MKFESSPSSPSAGRPSSLIEQHYESLRSPRILLPDSLYPELWEEVFEAFSYGDPLQIPVPSRRDGENRREKSLVSSHPPVMCFSVNDAFRAAVKNRIHSGFQFQSFRVGESYILGWSIRERNG
ncbi:hypothetical protein TWF694_004387 [Orbilia ellipsospora]|uniref:Uncharacterized protein n=1 Tax=Orbilia ellipsospora TaxID=2528407 RepID=A0AAV9WUZ3_9PEZI